MFSDVPDQIAVRMTALAERAAAESPGIPASQRLRQIPADTGRFLALLAASAPQGTVVEIGTSGGYSTLWLAVAAAGTGRKIITFEVFAAKAELARETFREAGVEHLVELVHADARLHLGGLDDIGFCFLDCDKHLYAECYELIIPNLVPGGLLVADNVTSHGDELQTVVDRAHADPRVDAVVLPIGSGQLVCRRA